jgi:hypothetical protein
MKSFAEGRVDRFAAMDYSLDEAAYSLAEASKYASSAASI